MLACKFYRVFGNFLLLFTFLYAWPSCSQPEGDMASYFTDLHEAGTFNGNVLIVQSDSVLYSASFGYANGAKDRRLDADHLFGLGSIYKEFPAVAILQLVEKGRLSLEDRLSDLLPQFPAWAGQIQMKHLLNYTSGLARVDWPTYFQADTLVSPRILLRDLQQLEKLEHAPGSNYIYSNYNPILLMAIVEKRSGLPFDVYLEDNILKPHGIEGIQIEHKFPFTDDEQFALPFDGEFAEDDLAYELPTICGSLSGMYQWMSKLDSYEIVSKESMKQLSKKYEGEGNFQVALGVSEWKKDELNYHSHHGSSGNYECLIQHYLDEEFLIVLLTNQKNRNLFDIAQDVRGMVD